MLKTLTRILKIDLHCASVTVITPSSMSKVVQETIAATVENTCFAKTGIFTY